MPHDPRGSLWRKWDLHIHSPASFHWRGERLTGNREADDVLLERMVEALNSADADAFCIMDYWTFDGWFALRDYTDRNPGALKKAVFPGIELRLEAPTDYRLNTHFIFDDSLSNQSLRDFLATLRIGVVHRAPSPEALIELARQFDDGKLSVHGFKREERSDDSRMLLLGSMTAKVTRDSWRSASKALDGRLLVIQPYDTSDGLEKLDWKAHPYDDTELMRAAHFFETRNLRHIRLILGAGIPDKPEVSQDFFKTLGGRWKPVVSGSDAHRFADYGAFPEGKTSWIKADLSFAGLKQCTVDPKGRVYIGAEPPKVRHVLDNKTKYIDKLIVQKLQDSDHPENWFSCELPLNSGMVAVIGNKGSGKSALADIIALSGNAHCQEFEFLNDRRFRKSAENRPASFVATLVWSDGEELRVSLADDPKLSEPERVRYLPQQHLERLCSDVGIEGRTVFEEELRKVIFSHVPTAKRLGFATLDEVVRYRTEQAEEHAAGLRHQLSAVNASIHEIEQQLLPASIAALKAQIELREKELLAHSGREPSPVPMPLSRESGDAGVLSSKLDAVRLELERSRKSSEALQEQQVQGEQAATAAARLVQRLRNLESEVRRSLLEAEKDAVDAGIVLAEVVEYRIDVESVASRQDVLVMEASEVASRLLEVKEKEEVLQVELQELQEKASEPERLYQEFLASKAAWEQQRDGILGSPEAPGTLEYLRFRETYLKSEAPQRLNAQKAERLKLTEQLFDIVKSQLSAYRELYAPIASEAAQHKFLQEHLRIEFNVLVEGAVFSEKLVSMINQGRRGTFYGQAEGLEAARRLVQQAEFGEWTGVEKFLQQVMTALTLDQRDGRNQEIVISSQLRDGFTTQELYDFVFGLTYLRPRLTLQLSGREVAQLSPGERGILLLVFYLLLDREEIPLVIDQPEHNLDNASVYRLLEPCIRRAKNRRQIVLVTHNPNVAIVCDAEQVIAARIDKQDGYRITYESGAIENPQQNLHAVDVLEGSWPAFDARDAAYQRPAVA